MLILATLGTQNNRAVVDLGKESATLIFRPKQNYQG